MALTLRLSPANEEKVTALAAATGRSKNSLIDEAVAQYDPREEHRERVAAAFDRIEKRDAEALELLSR